MLRYNLCRKINKFYYTTLPDHSDFKRFDYQYLQKSKLPTLHFQPSLPRLPIPSLSKSCEKYLRSQKPLRSNEEFIIIEKLMKEFELKDGPKLQEELLMKDSKNKHTSYISAPWFEMYLKDRRPLPINYNPFIVFIDDPKPEYNDQLIRGTNLVISSLRFMKSLRKHYLEPEVYHLNPKKSDTHLFRSFTGLLPSTVSWYGAYLFKAYPLDMSQYENLFNTSRIPDKDIDRIFHDPSARHIIVMKNGIIYKVKVLDESGYIYEPNIIYSSLQWILRNDDSSEYSAGFLTTLNRNDWADIRKYLESTGNKDVLNDIDSSLFNLIFDTEKPTKDYKTLVKRYLCSNGNNRWFDKSFSLILQKDGVAGLNFEHSWGDGVAVLRYLTDIYKDSVTNPQIHPHSASRIVSSSNLVKKLDFVLDDTSKNYINTAKTNYLNVCKSLDIEIFEFLEFGKNKCKHHKISPDSLMQLAFQIAYYKLHRKFVSTYESCSTAAFKHGRTETVRPCTMETKALTEAMFSKVKPNNNTLLQMVKACSITHGNLIKEAAMGQGFDRHLFALQKLCQENGMMPQLFTNPLHKNFNHFTMSTSTLSSEVVMLGGFGPVVQDGFGIGYSIWNDRLGSIVTYYKNAADGSGFINCLSDTLQDLHSILK